MEIVSSQIIVYEPDFNPQTNKYQDKCPFEKRKPGNIMVCRCRHQEDTFNTVSQFHLHSKLQSHKDWVNMYGKHNEHIINENETLMKDKAMIYVDLEKQTTRAERYKRKCKELEKENQSLKEEMIKLRLEYKN